MGFITPVALLWKIFGSFFLASFSSFPGVCLGIQFPLVFLWEFLLLDLDVSIVGFLCVCNFSSVVRALGFFWGGFL